MRKLFTFLCAALMSVGSMMADTTVTWGATEFSSFGVDYLHASRTVKGITVTVNGGTNNFINVTEYGTTFNATIDNAFTFSTELGNITKIECTTLYANGTLGDGWTIGANSATWEGNTNTLNFGNAGSMLVVSNIIFTIGEPEPEPAGDEITVTWNSYDLPSSGTSFTKDGVTLTCDIDDDLYGPGTFTTDLGNFTQIVVSGEEACYIDATDGWSGNINQKTWTGNAAIVPFDGSIYSFSSDVTIVFTIEPASTPEPAKYYVVGNMTEWAVDENYEMNPNIYAETEEYFYALDLTTTSEFKVVKVEGENQTWYPTGMGNNYGQNGEITEDAEYTIYFRPNYNGGEDWFYNCIYVSKNEPEPAGEVTVVFAANNKTVERTVTLPHTFKCDWAAGMDEPDELDIIIHELYNDYYYCNNNIQASGSDQVEVGTEEDPKNDYITIKGVFEGTATVTGDYFDWITGEEGAHNYSITISIKGGTPTGVENVQTNHVQGTKFFRDGMLLIEKNGKIYNVMGAEVK